METTNKLQILRRRTGAVLTVVACLMALFHEYTTATLPLTGFLQMAVHLAFAMIIVALVQFMRNDSDHFNLKDLSSLLIILCGILWF